MNRFIFTLIAMFTLAAPCWAQVASVFERLDKNSDGKITADESPNPQAMERYDLNKDGAITLEEYNRASAAPKTPGSAPAPTDSATKPAASDMPPATSPESKPTGQAGSGAARIMELDKNRDGKITKEEANNAPWFDKVDANQDGVLDAAELARLPSAAVQQPGKTPSKSDSTSTPVNPQPPATGQPQGGGQLETLIKQSDKNGDGNITKVEANNAPWFDRVDGNQDGVLDKEELDAIRKRSGGGTNPMPNRPAPRPQSSAAPDNGVSRSPDGFVPDAPFVGEIGGSYIDPEFSESASQVVFQDMQNRVWIGDIDPATGLFKTTGRDYLMDENIVVVFDRPPQGRKFSTNGPEWTRDEKGHLVVYTKEDSAGIMQQFAARLVDGKSVVTQLTHQTYDCYGNMPSRFLDGKPPRVAYTHQWPIWKAKAAWVFLDQGAAPRELENFNYKQMSMWSAVSPHFLFVQQPEGAPIGQVAMSDADTGAVRVLTDDAGMKDDPGMFNAPEFGGELLLVCNVDNSALAIYRDEAKDGNTPWKRIATLTLPADAPFKFISSPETIASATGVGGVSYFSLLARENKERNSRGSIWVLGLGTDEKNRFARRVDDGTSSTVLEPEPFVGKNEVYVYYNAFDNATRQNGLRRAATGIKVGGTAKSAATPTTSAPAASATSTKASWDGAKVVVECLAADLDTTARFYGDGIGMKEVVGTGDVRVFAYGDAFLRLRRATQPKTEPAGQPLQQTTAANGIRYLSIVVRDLKAAEERLVKAGFPKPQTSQYVSLVTSPDGYLVELIGVPSRGEQLIAGIVVSDETAARRFYGEQLGFTFTESKPLPRTWGSRQMHYYDAGSAHVKLGQPDGQRAAATSGAPGIDGLTMLVSDVAAFRSRIESRGLQATAAEGATLFADPDGNRIALAAPDSIRNGSAPTTSQVKPKSTPAEADRIVAFLDKAELVPALRVADAAKATAFFAEGLGLKNQSGRANGPLQPLLFGGDGFTVKVRAFPRQAAALPMDIIARNGLRVITIPIVDLAAAVTRLRGLGFAVDEPKRDGNTAWTLVRNADGTPFELVERGDDARLIELGLVVPDLDEARAFFTATYGARELPERVSRLLPGERELRFTTGKTIFKCWSPQGTREPDAGALPDSIGFRYVTHNVTDAKALHDRLAARGIRPAEELSDYQGAASYFMIHGPGGALLEFVSQRGTPAATAATGTATPAPPNPPTGTAPATRQGASRIMELDKNADGRITQEEAGGAAWFGRVDGNSDGVLDAAELTRLRGGAPSTPPAAPAPAPPTAIQTSPISGPTLFRRAELSGLTDSAVAVNGFAIADLNRDGLPDLVATRQTRTTFFVRPGAEFPHDRLDVLINRGSMKFEPHTITITGSDLTQEKFGLSAEVPNLADFNGDGFLDLLITRSGGEKQQKHGNTLLISDGAWDKFRDISSVVGVQNLDGYNRQSSIADVNGDGWMDIAIGCDTIGRPDRYGSPHSRLYVFKPKGAKFTDGRFEDVAGTLGLDGFGGYTGDPAKDKAGPGIALRDLDNDGDLDLVQTYHADMTGAAQTEREAAANYAQGVWVWKNLLRESGQFRFQRVTDNGLAEEAKLRWNAEKRFYEPESPGTGLPYFALADTDNDGLLDLLAIGPNSTYWAPRADYTGGRFWRNLGGFRFERATENAGFASLDWNYKQLYEHNGWHLSAAMANTAARPAAGPEHKQPGLPSFGPGGNHPYFADVIFGDFDNDGWQDVVCLDRAELPGLQTYSLYYRNERGTFRLLNTAETGLDAGGISGEAADLNGDGLLDLVFAADPMNSAPGQKPDPDRLQSKAFLNTGLFNPQPQARSRGDDSVEDPRLRLRVKRNHWLRLTLTGLSDAKLIGGRIELTADGHKQTRWLHTNHSYKSGGQLDAHFGLGTAAVADVKVTLLDGQTKTFRSLAADQSLSLQMDKEP